MVPFSQDHDLRAAQSLGTPLNGSPKCSVPNHDRFPGFGDLSLLQLVNMLLRRFLCPVAISKYVPILVYDSLSFSFPQMTAILFGS